MDSKQAWAYVFRGDSCKVEPSCPNKSKSVRRFYFGFLPSCPDHKGDEDAARTPPYQQ